MPDRSYTPFIILGLPRTGSNLLLSGLRQHPRLLAFGELFNQSEIQFGYPELDRQYKDDRKLFEHRNASPLTFLEQTVYGRHEPQVRAAGFKLFYYQLGGENPMLKQVWGYLNALPDLRVILLRRENLFKQLTSYRLAQQTQRWVQNSYAVDGIDISSQDCEKMFSLWEQYQTKGELMFKDKPVLSVSYETLAADFSATQRELFDFLEVEPLVVKPQTRKQRKRPITEMVRNYAELKSCFQSGPWARFFTD